jgi:hypothetical protein
MGSDMTRLTTLKAVRSYLGTKAAGVDETITLLIERASDFIQQKVSRKFPSETISNRRFNGVGSNFMLLPSSPVLSVESVTIDNRPIPVSDGIQQGYLFDDRTLFLIGGLQFSKGLQNVVLSWTAGYRESESQVIPSGNTPTLTPRTGGRPIESVSVTYDANGAALTIVGSSPQAGQYTMSEDGEHGFNQSDSGASVTMTYYFVPPTIVQACIELVGLKLQQRDKIGLKTKTLATESINFEDAEVTPSIAGLLSQYTRRTPN